MAHPAASLVVDTTSRGPQRKRRNGNGSSNKWPAHFASLQNSALPTAEAATSAFEVRKEKKTSLAILSDELFAHFFFLCGVDPVEPDTFWINPYGVHFGLLTVSDMVRVDAQGVRVGGADKLINTAGFIIHAAIHQRRPDINAACHLHSPFARAWSNFGRPIDMLNQDSCMFYGDLAVYANFGGVVFAKEEGARLADALGPTMKTIILQNHGSLTCGGTVAEAAAFFIALERACHCQLLTEAAVAPDGSQLRKTIVGDEEAAYTKRSTGSPEVMYMQFEPEYQLILKETQGDFLI